MIVFGEGDGFVEDNQDMTFYSCLASTSIDKEFKMFAKAQLFISSKMHFYSSFFEINVMKM